MNRALLSFIAGSFACAAAATHTRGQVGDCCPCDIDRDYQITSNDTFQFIDFFFRHDDRADFDGDKAVTVADYNSFMACYTAGCPCLQDYPNPTIFDPRISSCQVTIDYSLPCVGAGGQSPCRCVPLNISFPTTGWHVCLMNKDAKGLYLGNVEFRKPGTNQYTPILKEAGPAEIYVVYHPMGSPRVSDTQFSSPPGPLVEIVAADLPASGGFLATFTGDSVPRVAVECREYGIGWLCKQGGTHRRWRGYEVVVWAVEDADNYDNITEYRFRDDGKLSMRMGTSGWVSINETHMHNVLWRIDTDLGGAQNDAVFETVHREPVTGSPFFPLDAADTEVPFNGGVEGFIDWNPAQFTTLKVEDTVLTNGRGHPIGYELRPFDREGSSRHYGGGEDWTRHDFWVTRYHPGEEGMVFSGSPPPQHTWARYGHHLVPDLYLGVFAATDATLAGGTGPESITGGQDLVLWCTSAHHHEPTAEDHMIGDPDNNPMGINLPHWHGFDLVPHNFFDYNPLGGPRRCAP